MKHVYKCDYCRKTFDKESDCLEHEKKCMSLEGAKGCLNRYFVHMDVDDSRQLAWFLYPVAIDEYNRKLVCLEYRFFTDYYAVEMSMSTDKVRMIDVLEDYYKSDEFEFKEWMDKLSPYANIQITVKGAKE